MGKKFRYKAFVSYSHKDKKWGEWLLRALETYRIPKHLTKKHTTAGLVPPHIKPVFRDREELAAADNLSAEISNALASSEFLIVICSINAAQSHWVNKEITEFIEQHGHNNILCLIIDGEPNASINDNEECFPEILRNSANSSDSFEPIAADAREEGDGKKFAFLKIVSGIIGVGLDEVIRRDLQRKNRRVMAITVTSLLGVLAMGLLTYEARDARIKAELSREEAEGLVEFMITDLKEKLEPVARLDILESVGKKITSYYDNQEVEDTSEDALGQKSRAIHILGQNAYEKGDNESALLYFQTASLTTNTLLKRNPFNPDRIFEHSQSVYWVGFIHWKESQYEQAIEAFFSYKKYATQLVSLNPENKKWQMELSYALSNIGTLYLRNMGEPEKAYEIFSDLVITRTKMYGEVPKKSQDIINLANSYAWLADAAKITRHSAEAIKNRQMEVSLLESAILTDPENYQLKGKIQTSIFGLSRLKSARGEFDEALSLLKKSAEKAELLTIYDANNMTWLTNLARHYLYITKIYLAINNTEEAEISLELADKYINKRLQNSALNFSDHVLLINLRDLLKAILHYQQLNSIAALEEFNLIIEELSIKIKKGLDLEDFHHFLATAHFYAGSIENESGGKNSETSEHLTQIHQLLSPLKEKLHPEALAVLGRSYLLNDEQDKALPIIELLETRGYDFNTQRIINKR